MNSFGPHSPGLCRGCQIIVHRPQSLFRNAASYFKAALDGEFLEAEKNILDLPADSALVFKRLLPCFYTDSLYEKSECISAIAWELLGDMDVFESIRP